MPNLIRRRYSDAFRAGALAALDANGGNLRRTARELDIKPSTLKGWAAGRTAVPADLRALKRQDLAEALEDFAVRLAAAGPGTPNLRDIGVALGITVDKLLLVRGQPNQHTLSDSAAVTFDFTRLTREELSTLVDLHDKVNGVPPLEMASDLAYPECIDETSPCGYTLPNGPRPGR